MVYILSVTLKQNKKVKNELKSLYGVGLFQSSLLCNQLNIGTNCYVSELTQSQVYKLLKQIEQNNLNVENDLKKQKSVFINDLIDIKTYRGVRHIFNLPVRGQRTRTNARSRKRVKTNK